MENNEELRGAAAAKYIEYLDVLEGNAENTELFIKGHINSANEKLKRRSTALSPAAYEDIAAFAAEMKKNKAAIEDLRRDIALHEVMLNLVEEELKKKPQ